MAARAVGARAARRGGIGAVVRRRAVRGAALPLGRTAWARGGSSEAASPAAASPPARCAGCGVAMQSEFPDRTGFVDEAALVRYADALAGTGREEPSPAADSAGDDDARLLQQSEPSPEADAALARLAAEAEQDEALRLMETRLAEDAGDEELIKLLSGEEGRFEYPRAPARRRAPVLTCQRCHHLTHYGARRGAVDVVDPDELYDSLERRLGGNASAVVVMVYDLFDFHGSHLPRLHRLVGRNPLIMVANKVDLLPEGAGLARVRSWLKGQAREMGLDPHSVHLVSAKTGYGVKGLLRAARDLATKVTLSRRRESRAERAAVAQYRLAVARQEVEGDGGAGAGAEDDSAAEDRAGGGTLRSAPSPLPAALRPARVPRDPPPIRDIYVVGSANVGKSSLVNAWGRKRLLRSRHAQRVTVSPVAGTTQDFIAMPLSAYDDVGVRGSGGGPARAANLFDTPGMKTDLTSALTVDELAALTPTKRVRPVTYRLRPGKSLLLGGLARVDMLGPEPCFFTAVVSPGASVHVTATARADAVQTRAGDVVWPPFGEERAAEIGLRADSPSREFSLPLRGWEDAAVDLVFPGIGWVGVTGSGTASVRVFPARGGSVFLREPLMPYESAATSRRFTSGGKRA